MKRWGWIWVALCVAGCAAGKPKNPFLVSGFLSARDLEKRKQAEVEKGRLRDLVPPSEEAGKPKEYKVGPGDTLQIDIAKRTELSGPYLVSDRGFIVFPLLGEVSVAGLNVDEIKAKLEAVLSKYIRQPEAKIVVAEFGSQKVIVFGALGDFSAEKQMTLINLKKPTPLLEFMAGVGGPRADADLRHITLLHKDGNKDVVDLNRLLFQADPRVNIFVFGGDTVYVPSLKEGKNKVLVLGAVLKPGLYSFDSEMTVLQATAMAGSFIRASTPEKTFVIRTDVENPYMIRVDLRRVLTEGESQRDLLLKKGDIVFIPPNSITTYNKYMADIQPTLQNLELATSVIIDVDAIAGIFDRGFGKSTVEVADEIAARSADRSARSASLTGTTTGTTATTTGTQ